MSEKINQDFAFGKKNYQLLVIGVVITIIGYMLLAGGGSDDPKVFSEDLFNFRRIYLAPIVILTGLGVVGWGIMKKSN